MLHYLRSRRFQKKWVRALPSLYADFYIAPNYNLENPTSAKGKVQSI